MTAMRLAVSLCGAADDCGHRRQGNRAATPAAGNAGAGAWGEAPAARHQSIRRPAASCIHALSPPYGQVERLKLLDRVVDPEFE
jgi:hypothetical protein